MKTARPPRAIRRHLARGAVDFAEPGPELPRSPFALRLLITASAFLVFPVITFFGMVLPILTGEGIEMTIDGAPVRVTAENWGHVTPFVVATGLILAFSLLAIPLSARFALRRRLWYVADADGLHLYRRMGRRSYPWGAFLPDVRVEAGQVRLVRQRPGRTLLDDALMRADVDVVWLDVKDPERVARAVRKRIAR